jgi:hypothetical protein
MLKESGMSAESKDAKRAAAAKFIVDFLRAGSVKASDVYLAGDKNGHSQRTLRRAAKELEIIVTPPTGGRDAAWSLPQSILDAIADEEDDGES